MTKLNIFIVCICLLIPFTAVSAQNACTDLKMACEKYEICLKTGHCELITSTLIHLMKMYHQYPAHDYSRIIGVLDSLATTMNYKPVCTKALLTKQYLSGEKDLDWMMDFSYEEIYNFLRVWYAAGFSGVAHEHSARQQK